MQSSCVLEKWTSLSHLDPCSFQIMAPAHHFATSSSFPNEAIVPPLASNEGCSPILGFVSPPSAPGDTQLHLLPDQSSRNWNIVTAGLHLIRGLLCQTCLSPEGSHSCWYGASPARHFRASHAILSIKGQRTALSYRDAICIHGQ